MIDIPNNHVEQIQYQLDNGAYEENLIGLGRNAPIYELIFQCVDYEYSFYPEEPSSTYTYYRVEVECDLDGDVFNVDDILEELVRVKPFEIVKTEWR